MKMWPACSLCCRLRNTRFRYAVDNHSSVPMRAECTITAVALALHHQDMHTLLWLARRIGCATGDPDHVQTCLPVQSTHHERLRRCGTDMPARQSEVAMANAWAVLHSVAASRSSVSVWSSTCSWCRTDTASWKAAAQQQQAAQHSIGCLAHQSSNKCWCTQRIRLASTM